MRMKILLLSARKKLCSQVIRTLLAARLTQYYFFSACPLTSLLTFLYLPSFLFKFFYRLLNVQQISVNTLDSLPAATSNLYQPVIKYAYQDSSNQQTNITGSCLSSTCKNFDSLRTKHNLLPMSLHCKTMHSVSFRHNTIVWCLDVFDPSQSRINNTKMTYILRHRSK